MDIKKVHPAFPETFGEFSLGHRLRVTSIILGREALYSYLEYAEILTSHEERAEKRREREARIAHRVGVYLREHELSLHKNDQSQANLY